MTETTGLKGGASCSHRNKKSFFKLNAVRRKLKDSKTQTTCEECERCIKNGHAAPESVTDDLLVCVSCGKIACEEHAKKHCEADKSELHPFLYSMTKNILRCHPCDVDLEPTDDPADAVRDFYSKYKDFTKTKAQNDAKREKEKEEEKDVTDGKNTQAVAVPPPPPPPPPAPNAWNGKNLFTSTEKMSSLKISDAFEKVDPFLPAKGLANLGNTCFFNSVMQCIMHTHHLDHYFTNFGRVNLLHFDEEQMVTINEEKLTLEAASMSVPEEEVPLNVVVRQFISEYRYGHSPQPSSVFSQISKKAPRFKGWQQQDAHELLRYLLDGLRSEELERYKTAIANHFGVSKEKRKNTEPIIVKKAKGYLQVAGRPLLDSVFGGTLLQTIRCCECHHVSHTFEEFLDLSVPMSANPMATTRLAAGANRKITGNQKKKAAKEAKKLARRKNTATKNKTATNDESTANNKEETPIAAELSDDELSDEESEPMGEEEISSEESQSGEDEEDERLAGGAAAAVIGSRIDMTKVLVDAPREYHENRNVGACLLEFTAEELLAGPNSYECEGCCAPRNKKLNAKGNDKKRVEAVKRYLIYEPPAILTLQLKRFQQVPGYGGRLNTRKLGGHVDFPLLFNIAPFCCKKVQRIAPGQTELFYSLYGVVVHSGDLSGGHYIAYVKSRHRVTQALDFIEAARSTCVDAMASKPTVTLASAGPGEPSGPDGQWYYCSDSRVQMVSVDQVQAAEAYILFYERLS